LNSGGRFGFSGYHFVATSGNNKHVLVRRREFVREDLFDNELEFLARLGHENIVSVLRLLTVKFEDHLTKLFTVPYYNGGDLSHCQGLSADKKFEITKGIFAALEYLHDLGIIHRRISMDHILIDNDGRAILTGFRHAVSLDSRKQVYVGKRVGDFIYWALEIITRHLSPNVGGSKLPYSYDSDLWAAIIVLIKLYNEHDFSFEYDAVCEFHASYFDRASAELCVIERVKSAFDESAESGQKLFGVDKLPADLAEICRSVLRPNKYCAKDQSIGQSRPTATELLETITAKGSGLFAAVQHAESANDGDPGVDYGAAALAVSA